MRVPCFLLAGITVVAAPGPVWATGLPDMTVAMIFTDSAPVMKAIMLLLIVVTIAAVVVTVSKLRSGPRLAGGSAFLQALRLGGPLIGLLGAAYNALVINIGIANVGNVPYAVLAPGVAEAVFLFVLGLVAGVVAVIFVEARIDRTVLRA